MIFTKENAGKWVASKGGTVLAADTDLDAVLNRIKKEDLTAIVLDLVPPTPFLAGGAV